MLTVTTTVKISGCVENHSKVEDIITDRVLSFWKDAADRVSYKSGTGWQYMDVAAPEFQYSIREWYLEDIATIKDIRSVLSHPKIAVICDLALPPHADSIDWDVVAAIIKYADDETQARAGRDLLMNRIAPALGTTHECVTVDIVVHA